MHMIVYVFDAETMISIAAGTITEVKIGIFDISLSADGALMAIRFAVLCAPCLFCRIPEVYSLCGAARFSRANVAQNVVPADDEKV